MASKKTFIVYSREDSEFVLNLAKDLRAADAKCWAEVTRISQRDEG